MLQTRSVVLFVPGLQSVEYDAVRPFAVQPDLTVFPEHYGHATSDVIEIQNTQ